MGVVDAMLQCLLKGGGEGEDAHLMSERCTNSTFLYSTASCTIQIICMFLTYMCANFQYSLVHALLVTFQVYTCTFLKKMNEMYTF